jgi:hypothetical protein
MADHLPMTIVTHKNSWQLRFSLCRIQSNHEWCSFVVRRYRFSFRHSGVTTSLKPNTLKIRLEPLRERRDFRFTGISPSTRKPDNAIPNGTARLGGVKYFDVTPIRWSMLLTRTNVLVSANLVLCRTLSWCHSIQREISPT